MILPPGRIPGLDVWRALLMSAGLFVHGSLWLPPTALFFVIGDASQAFRMGAFFAISGFLSSLALRRREPARWLLNRLTQLGLPAFSGLLILSPLIWYAVTTSKVVAFGWALLPFEWHHLWFLFGLMFYSTLAVLLHSVDSRVGLMRRLDAFTDARSGRIGILVVAVSSACLLGSALPPMRFILPHHYIQSFGNIQLIAGYLPMFMLGFVLARADQLCRHIADAHRFGLMICVVMIAAYGASHTIAAFSSFEPYVRFLAAVLCPPAAFSIILYSALKVRHVPPFVEHLSDASYTIYILHYPISILLNTRLGIGIEPHLAYALSVLASGAAAFSIHVLAVQRCSTLALILNGKRGVSAASVTAPANV